MTDRNHDHDHDVDRDREHDEPKHGDKALAPAQSKGGAVASLETLTTAFNAVDTTSASGHSIRPLLLYHSRGDTWGYGQQQIVPEEGSRWGVNILSFERGYVCFGDNGKRLGEKMLPIRQPMLDSTTLPDLGFKWNEQWSVDFKCTSGTDAGVEVTHKSTTVGGMGAIIGLFDAVRARLNSGQHNDKVAPIVCLEQGSYQHSQYGRVCYPVLRIVDWMSLSGPASASAAPPPPPRTPAPTTPAAEQPRRRRVA
jgi:hypothetical protein